MGRAHEALYILEILAISYAGNHRKIESQRHKTNYTLEKRTVKSQIFCYNTPLYKFLNKKVSYRTF